VSTSVVSCQGCGAPLEPEAGAMRATCSYCGAVNDIASEGALKLAEKLAGKIRVAPRLMTVDEISAQIAEREEAKEAERRHAIRVATVLGIVFVLVLGLVLGLASR
jgi:LSD1 subclass zinc finger protein